MNSDLRKTMFSNNLKTYLTDVNNLIRYENDSYVSNSDLQRLGEKFIVQCEDFLQETFDGDKKKFSDFLEETLLKEISDGYGHWESERIQTMISSRATPCYNAYRASLIAATGAFVISMAGCLGTANPGCIVLATSLYIAATTVAENNFCNCAQNTYGSTPSVGC